MTRSADEFKLRTKHFSLRVMRLVDSLPNKRSASHIGGQLFRSATSVAANYRSACRGRSQAEFCSKLGIVEEEADESVFWIELLSEAKIIPAERLKDLQNEATEILRMVVASIQTARRPQESFRSADKSRNSKSAVRS
ncbi:MAG TPA: four helix bundle protein [Planctomycetaceae bacterium]|nr:four helix bundle protein [Planctomycetaceae bacterium]